MTQRCGRARLVVGAPGTGKSRLAVNTVVEHVRGGRPGQSVLLLAPTRASADRLREAFDIAVGTETTGEIARSWSSLAFELLERRAQIAHDPLIAPPPVLLTGPEQDVVIAELLRGQVARDGLESWPDGLRSAVGARGFRDELRDLFLRATEHGLDGRELAALGERQGRPEWVSAGSLLEEYLATTALQTQPRLDPSTLLSTAAGALEPQSGDVAEKLVAALHDELELLVVDDAHELTVAAAELLLQVRGPNTQVLLLADPDATTQGFRGAQAELPARLAAEWDAQVDVLEHGHRVPAGIQEAALRVGERIGTAGVPGHRHVSAPGGGSCQVEVLGGAASEAAHVAGVLRRWHLEDEVPYAEMAVLMRGRGRSEAMRRTLGTHGVPVQVQGGGIALRDEPAVWPLLLAVQVAVRAAAGHEDPLCLEEAVALLTSTIGRGDAVALRRVRRSLRRAELDSARAGRGLAPTHGQDPAGTEGTALPRRTDDLLVDACLRGGELPLSGVEMDPVRRVSRTLTATTEAVSSGGSAHQVIWAAWASTGLEADWHQASQRPGAEGRRADMDLDAVVALVRAAEQLTERVPGAGPGALLEHLRSQDLAADTLAAQAQGGESVALVTAQTAAGQQWRRVIIAGVQEGVWPDLRVRGSVLGSEVLADQLMGRGTTMRERSRAVREDELRTFYVALTRATERVLVTCAQGADEYPSPFIDLIDPLPPGEERPVISAAEPMTLRTLVASSRRTLGDVDTSAEARSVAAARLKRLSGLVPEAEPGQWWGLRGTSTDRPIVPDGEPVRLSPSRVELVGTCPLRWLLQSHGGDDGDRAAAELGTLVHAIVEELPHAEEATLHETLEQRWVEEGLGSDWLSLRSKDEAKRMLTRYAEYHRAAQAEGWMYEGAERSARFDLGRARVVGRLDRVERHGTSSAVRVVDLKTGKTVPSHNDTRVNPQLGIYQLAVERDAVEGSPGGPGTSGGALLLYVSQGSLKSAVREQQPPGDDGLGWVEDLVTDAAETMSGAELPARVGEGCRACPVRSSCPGQDEGRELA